MLPSASMLPSAGLCHGLGLGTDAIVVRPFGPIGPYAGHWGVDIASAPGQPVRAIGAGTVSFAGSVAERKSVTVDHGGALRTSYSYLAAIAVTEGQTVSRGTPVGTSGIHDGADAFHVSLRVGATYVDPLSLAGCSRVPGPALWLAEVKAG